MKNGTEELNCNFKECLTMAELQSNDLEEQLNTLKLKCLDIGELHPNDLENLLKLLRLRTSYYEEETAKIESVFRKLQLMDEELKLFKECEELVEKLNNVQKQFNLKEVTPNAVALSHADKLRKHRKYAAKLKICIKMYIELNETLTKKIKHLKSNYEQAKEKVNQIVTATQDEVKAIEKKIGRYEQELTKLEKKYSWLKTSDFSLPNISKEINMLIMLRNDKEELLKELSCYHGLKPDLQEASEQLSQVKAEYEELNKKLLNK